MELRSHVYSNCRVLQALLSSGPLLGNTSSANANTGRGSKIGKASNKTALGFTGIPHVSPGRNPERAAPLRPLPARDRNSRRVVDKASPEQTYAGCYASLPDSWPMLLLRALQR